MAFGKRNVVKLDPFMYNIALIGESGIGKSTIIKEMCEKYLPEDGYLFVECGKEAGADAISNIRYVNCPDWNSDYDDVNNSVGFKLLIDDIVENKETDYKNLRVLVIDTYDQLREIAGQEIVRLHNKEHEKKVKSLKAAYGGFMAGEDMADDLCLDMLWELKQVNVQFIAIGHVKTKDITDSATGETYVELTSDLTTRTFNKLKNKLHFLGVAYIDREIVKKKKEGTDKLKGHVKSETRKITFRDDNYSVDSKSRFADIAEECDFTPEALYETMCNAIKAEATKGKGGVKEAEKETKIFEEAKEEKALENSHRSKDNKIDSDKNQELIEQIKPFFTDKEVSKEVLGQATSYMKDNGIDNFKDPESIPTKVLEEILRIVSQV